ncbi:MAG: hypothetical protein Q4G09_07170 [Clostridia bacterium]|nr:hypothetical protein [Clostridia bacterium]
MHHGQEIYSFFNIYGAYGIIGIILSMCLIGFIIYKTFKIILENKIEVYQDFITNIMPQRLKDNKMLAFTINNIINIFLLISFNIMVAGFCTYFFQELNISKWYGAIVIAILSFATFSKSIDGIMKINTYLMPILILLIVFLGINKINNISFIEIVIPQKILKCLLSSVLYASYNSITLIPIIISLKKHIKTKAQAKQIAIITTIIMLVLSIIIFLLINLFSNEIKNIEIPITYIANTLGKQVKYIYGVVILIAIFTTAISAGYGFLNNVCKTKKGYIIMSSIMCICSVFVGQFGFSNLINLLYPIFGYLGIIQIVFLLKII